MELSPQSLRRSKKLLQKGLTKESTAKLLGRRREKVDAVQPKTAAKRPNEPSLPGDCAERIRIRTLVSLVQAGGSYRDKALRRLRPSHKNPYLRYVVAGYYAEHSHRALDDTSRKLLLFLWEAIPTPDNAEHFILCIVVFVRMCLVDNEPVARFVLALRAGKEFTTVAREALDQLGVTRPSAYFPWGRGATAAEYDANRRTTLSNLLDLLQKNSKITYSPLFFQQLLQMREEETESQFSVMQLAMDLIASPCVAQRRQVAKTKALFYMSGPGVYDEIKGRGSKFRLCKEWATQLHRNSQWRAIRTECCLKVDYFFFAEHAFCGDRKFLDSRFGDARDAEAVAVLESKLQVEMQAHNVSSLGELLKVKYVNVEKEAEYQKVLQILGEVL